MVDPVRLARLLQRLGEQLAFLHRLAALDRARLRGDEVVAQLGRLEDLAHLLERVRTWAATA